MDDEELRVRFAGMRLALAYAIKAASRTPDDLNHHREASRGIEGPIPAAVHPAAKEELDGVIAALIRSPVRDPTHGHDTRSARLPRRRSRWDDPAPISRTPYDTVAPRATALARHDVEVHPDLLT